MSRTPTIVLRLVGGRYEGQWLVVPDPRPTYVAEGLAYGKVAMVPTGCVEWDGDRCAEVYVPEDKLPLWRAEHDVDGDYTAQEQN